MKKQKNILPVFRRLYKLLEPGQKFQFLLIICIMMISAGLSQLTPQAIG